MKSLAAFILVLLILLSACFSYAHLKLYQHQFERTLMDEGVRALRSESDLSRVSLSFDGLHARLSGLVAHPTLKARAQAKIDAISGAVAVPRLNLIRVAPVIQIEPVGSGGFRVSGWLPSDSVRERLAHLLQTSAPQQRFDVSAVQLDAEVLDPAYLNQTSLPTLLATFFQVVGQGAMVLEPDRLKLTGTVRTETEKLTLHSLALRTMAGPGNPAVENGITFPAPADARTRPPAWVGSTVPGMDLSRALRSFPIFFDSGSSTLKADEVSKVDQWVAAIRQLGPKQSFVLTGYADSSGSPAANQRISLRRAETVAAQLVARGLPRGQFELKSVVEKANPADAKNPEARRRSRRVELTVKDTTSRTP